MPWMETKRLFDVGVRSCCPHEMKSGGSRCVYFGYVLRLPPPTSPTFAPSPTADATDVDLYFRGDE